MSPVDPSSQAAPKLTLPHGDPIAIELTSAAQGAA
jgi:hypothetical protein